MKTSQLHSWAALEDHAKPMRDIHLRELFEQNPNRFEDFSASFGTLLLDLSRQRITRETQTLLLDMIRECKLEQWIKDLFGGAHVNASEDRPALHTALRLPEDHTLSVGGKNIVEDVHLNLNKMERMIHAIHSGQWRGYHGYPVDTIVNIGVGGSDLGPLMACNALQEFQPDAAKSIKIHFVSSMDGSQLATLLDSLNPASTLFVISSKSFTTIDTLANASTALEWLLRASGVEQELVCKRHFVGISSNQTKMNEWGIPEENQLEFWDWTGGRYSMWSAIGFSTAVRIGMDKFREMLHGAHHMDEHFRSENFEHNLPVLLALAEIWNINFLGIRARAVLPYDGRLRYLPAYLEQLEMESNGKSSTRQGEPVDYNTCPVIWGEIGPNAQHAFYQLLHQGTEMVMCDFIATAIRRDRSDELRHQHDLTLANFLAQSRILALGDSVLTDSENTPAYKRYRGNQPSTTLLLKELSPFSFGQMIALYEHKTFVQSVAWNINPFDQWGVELGKKVSTGLIDPIKTGVPPTDADGSTAGLIHYIERTRSTDNEY